MQPKLKVGTPGDKYEREADSVANHLMKMPDRDGTIRRSRGGPEPAIPESMELHFGRSFSDVRVHADSQAATSAEALGAQAYTIGRDIFFGRAKYSPGTPAGDRLLAHELTHVVQQSRAKDEPGQIQIERVRVPLIQRALEDSEAVRDSGFTVIPFAEVERARRFVEQRLRGVPASDGIQRIGELSDLVFLHELQEYLGTLRPSTPEQIAKLATLLNATRQRIRELKAGKEARARREQRRARAAKRRERAEAESAVPEGVDTTQVRSFADAVARLKFARNQATKDTPDYTLAAEAVEQVVAWMKSVSNEENLREHFPRPATYEKVAEILWNTHNIDSVLIRMRIQEPAGGLWEKAVESLEKAGPLLRELSGEATHSDRQITEDVEWATSQEAGWLTAGIFAGATVVTFAAAGLTVAVAEYGLSSGLVGNLSAAIIRRPEFWYEVFTYTLGSAAAVVAAGPEKFIKSVATPQGALEVAYQVITLMVLRGTSMPRFPGADTKRKGSGAPVLEQAPASPVATKAPAETPDVPDPKKTTTEQSPIETPTTQRPIQEGQKGTARIESAEDFSKRYEGKIEFRRNAESDFDTAFGKKGGTANVRGARGELLEALRLLEHGHPVHGQVEKIIVLPAQRGTKETGGKRTPDFVVKFAGKSELTRIEVTSKTIDTPATANDLAAAMNVKATVVEGRRTETQLNSPLEITEGIVPSGDTLVINTFKGTELER